MQFTVCSKIVTVSTIMVFGVGVLMVCAKTLDKFHVKYRGVHSKLTRVATVKAWSPSHLIGVRTPSPQYLVSCPNFCRNL